MNSIQTEKNKEIREKYTPIFGKELTDNQCWFISTCLWGAGISAKPSQLSAKHRREADELVAVGILEKAKNYRGDTTGMYVIAEKYDRRSKSKESTGESFSKKYKEHRSRE